MFALDAKSRALLATAAFTAFGAAFVTTPMVARGEPGTVAEPPPPFASPVPRTMLTDVVPRRDPFAGGDTPLARSNATLSRMPIAVPAMPTLTQIPAALRALPPNAGAGDGAFPFTIAPRTTAIVTAVVTGPHPFALVDESGTTRVLTVGDRIGGDAIAAIGTDGVRLSGGTTLPIAPPSGAPQPPSPHAVRPVPATITSHPIPGGR